MLATVVFVVGGWATLKHFDTVPKFAVVSVSNAVTQTSGNSEASGRMTGCTWYAESIFRTWKYPRILTDANERP